MEKPVASYFKLFSFVLYVRVSETSYNFLYFVAAYCI